jgi:hypothetical protein
MRFSSTRAFWLGFPLAAQLLLGCGDTGPGAGECQEGDSQCLSLTEIQYCLNGSWMAAETCPPEQGDGFSITTICDSGLCRP